MAVTVTHATVAVLADDPSAEVGADEWNAGHTVTNAMDKTLLDAKGDIIAASAADTPAKVTVGANDTILMADSAQTAGLKWVASQTPSTQAFGDAAAEGTADTYARGDHKHAMPSDADLTLAPSGSYETAPRRSAVMGVATTPVSGTLYLVACYIPSGFVVGHITFVGANVAAGSPTHWWYGLYDSSRVQLAVTADQTSAAYGTFAPHTLAIATIASGASSTFTTTYSGLYYIGWMMTATTVATNYGGTVGGSSAGIAPILAGTSTTSLTTPPAFPTTAGAITADGGYHPYAYVTP